MFIKQSDIENVIQNTNDDKSTAYIILQNNQLHSKYNSISRKLSEITAQKDELEEYGDKLELSKAHIQGIAKNQYLISQEKSKEISFRKNCYQYMLTALLYSYAIHIPYNFLLLFSVFSIKVKVSLFILTYSFYINRIVDLYRFRKEALSGKEITSIEDELRCLDKSNDHLHELIDNF